MARHPFNFDGGEDLTTMGAAWFTSYSYHNYIDCNHTNWENVSTASNRRSVYNRTKERHNYWLRQIVQMNDKNLDKNTLGLKGTEIIRMAQELLNHQNTNG